MNRLIRIYFYIGVILLIVFFILSEISEEKDTPSNSRRRNKMIYNELGILITYHTKTYLFIHISISERTDTS